MQPLVEIIFGDVIGVGDVGDGHPGGDRANVACLYEGLVLPELLYSSDGGDGGDYCDDEGKQY